MFLTLRQKNEELEMKRELVFFPPLPLVQGVVFCLYGLIIYVGHAHTHTHEAED